MTLLLQLKQLSTKHFLHKPESTVNPGLQKVHFLSSVHYKQFWSSQTGFTHALIHKSNNWGW